MYINAHRLKYIHVRVRNNMSYNGIVCFHSIILSRLILTTYDWMNIFRLGSHI